MVEAVQFENLNHVDQWLKAKDVRMSHAFAARAALRSLPAAMATQNQDLTGVTSDQFILTCFRATLTTAVASTCPTSSVTKVRALSDTPATALQFLRFDIKASPTNPNRAKHVQAAAQAACAAAISAHCSLGAMDGAADEADRSIAQSAASAAVSAAARSLANRSAMQAAALSDGTRLRDGGVDAHFSAPLWSDDAPVSDLLAGWETFQKRDDLEAVWAFWVQWYRGMFDGNPMDWDLQLQVALIEDAVWQEGPKAVAAAIQEIEAEWAAEHLPQADRIVVDEDTGKFDTSPLELSSAGIVQTALEQIAFARRIAERSNCGFNTTSVAWEYIEFALNGCRDNANAIEQNFEIARADIADGLENGTYFEDPKLSALERVLDTAVTDLRAHHPEVIEAWEKRVQVKLRIAQDDQKQLIVEKATELIAISSPTLGNELELDAKTISNSSGEVQGGAIRRFFGRVAQMRLLLRSSEIVKRIDASTGYKGTRVVQTLHSLVEMIIGLF